MERQLKAIKWQLNIFLLIFLFCKIIFSFCVIYNINKNEGGTTL